MDVREVYQRIQELQDEIAAVGPLAPEVRKQINNKFRLDWNFYSNNIEGGTLTVAETKSIMLGHVTVESKPLKDILEMKGHDQTIKTVMAIGKGEVLLSEKRIKEIHAAIIHEDDPSLKSSIGKWKTLANEIKNPRNGLIFRFIEPEEVPEAIHKLLDWFKAESEKLNRGKSEFPAPRLAFEFHLRFLTIHPFHDGNGRVGRILLNLILISMGYPPIIITDADKPLYEDLLTEIQVNGGSQNDLWVFLGKLLIRSLEKVRNIIAHGNLISQGARHDVRPLVDLVFPRLNQYDSLNPQMDTLHQHIVLAEQLKQTLDNLPALSHEDEAQLWKKLRLEWNYNSNHIEGNTLTYSETEVLLMFDRTSGEHTLQEYEEMRAHDVAIALVREWAADTARELTEMDIRALNKTILVRPFWKEAMTSDGQSTRRLIEVGVYKRHPNSVRTKTGEIFSYASPEETPRLMAELMDWYRNDTDGLPVASIAAEFHYRFIRIHPFDDGNGRVARLLVNYLLLRHGYLPIVIKSEEKDKYLTALQKADAGDVLAFHVFIAEQMAWPLRLAIKAARGERLDEPGDSVKRLELLKRRLKASENEEAIQVPFSAEVATDIANGWFRQLVEQVRSQLVGFEELFLETEAGVWISKFHAEYKTLNVVFMPPTKPLAVSDLFSDLNHVPHYNTRFSSNFRLNNLKASGIKAITIYASISVEFTDIKYTLSYPVFDTTGDNPSQKSKTIARLLHQGVTEPEQVQIAEEIAQAVLDEIEYRLAH